MTDERTTKQQQNADSPYRALWPSKTQRGATKYFGDQLCPCCQSALYVNVYPNTNKRSDKAPDFHFALFPKQPRPATQ